MMALWLKSDISQDAKCESVTDGKTWFSLCPGTWLLWKLLRSLILFLKPITFTKSVLSLPLLDGFFPSQKYIPFCVCVFFILTFVRLANIDIKIDRQHPYIKKYNAVWNPVRADSFWRCWAAAEVMGMGPVVSMESHHLSDDGCITSHSNPQ